MSRYARLLWVQLRASAATAMAYRVDFLVDGLISLWWMIWSLVPLAVVFQGRGQVAGWTFAEALVVIAWFTLLRGVLEGAINPSMQAVIEHIRMGTLDFVLIKPADSQFLVSTARFSPWKIFDVLAGIAIAVLAFWRLGRSPAAEEIALAGVMLLAAAVTLYSIWILVICAAFWVIRLDNLSYLFSSVFDAARWPVQVFRGTWKFLFTFVIPLGILTTYPAMAILGKLEPEVALASVGGALAFAFLARAIWSRALSRYTSASS
jgi:ABC-2 type transport system permease protein